jgi:hypothetical protein
MMMMMMMMIIIIIIITITIMRESKKVHTEINKQEHITTIY